MIRWRQYQSPAIFGAAASGGPLGITSTATNSDTSGVGTAFTFSAQSLGASDPTRRIIVGVAGRSGSVINPLTSVTVDGISASSLVSIGSSSNTNVAALWMADLSADSNTTGNIVVTFAATPARFGIAVWRLVNANIASVVSGSDSQAAAATSSATLTIPSGGSAIGIGFIQDAQTAGSLSGLTTTDANLVLAASNGYAAGHANSMTGGSTALTFTWTGSFATCGAFAAWGP